MYFERFWIEVRSCGIYFLSNKILIISIIKKKLTFRCNVSRFCVIYLYILCDGHVTHM